MPFANKLRDLRKKRKWSQSDLADKVGIHPRHVGKYENGQVMPNAETLITIAKVFDVSVDYLLFDTQEPKQDNIQDQELAKYFNEVTRMDEKDKDVIKSLIDAYVKKRKAEIIFA